MTEQPDDLVTALSCAMRADVNDGMWTGWEQTARAVLARTDLVLPAADVIPKQAVLDLADRVALASVNAAEKAVWRALGEVAEALSALVAGGES